MEYVIYLYKNVFFKKFSSAVLMYNVYNYDERLKMHKAVSILLEAFSNHKIQATESLFEAVPDEVKANIKMHLGEDAFVWNNKPVRGYKDGKVPKFDFSGVLFSK